MTVEEIEQTLRTVAGNQAQLTEAQIRYEARQERLDETVKQIAESHQTIIQLVRAQEERIDGHDAMLRATDEKLNALVDAQIGFDSRQARLEESHQLLVQLARIQEERIDGHEATLRATDEKLNALIDAQIGFDSRQARLEESHQLLVQLARIQEERIDGQDEARLHTNTRLDALIDSQIQLTQRVSTLTDDIATLNVRFERTDERLDRISERLESLSELQADNAEQIKSLIAAQARTDERFRLLLDRSGAPKPKRTTARKSGSKRTAKPAKKKGMG
jgi:chromosome segregation ATPase